MRTLIPILVICGGCVVLDVPPVPSRLLAVRDGGELAMDGDAGEESAIDAGEMEIPDGDTPLLDGGYCQPESDQAFCAGLLGCRGARAQDNCGATRYVNCPCGDGGPWCGLNDAGQPISECDGQCTGQPCVADYCNACG